MIREIIKQTVNLGCIVGLTFMFGCHKQKQCNCKDSIGLIQEFKVNNITAKTMRIDHGTYGYSVLLQICDSENYLIEEVGLRGEDYLPVLDSIIGFNVYIHYSFPHKNKINFGDVVIGKALLKEENLKFKYYFHNN